MTAELRIVGGDPVTDLETLYIIREAWGDLSHMVFRRIASM
jgi:hypothetical protein